MLFQLGTFFLLLRSSMRCSVSATYPPGRCGVDFLSESCYTANIRKYFKTLRQSPWSWLDRVPGTPGNDIMETYSPHDEIVNFQIPYFGHLNRGFTLCHIPPAACGRLTVSPGPHGLGSGSRHYATSCSRVLPLVPDLRIFGGVTNLSYRHLSVEVG